MDDKAVGEEAMDVSYQETGEEAYTDKAVIQKIWAGCLKCGYISQYHGTMGLRVDKVVVRVIALGQR